MKMWRVETKAGQCTYWDTLEASSAEEAARIYNAQHPNEEITAVKACLEASDAM